MRRTKLLLAGAVAASSLFSAVPAGAQAVNGPALTAPQPDVVANGFFNQDMQLSYRSGVSGTPLIVSGGCLKQLPAFVRADGSRSYDYYVTKIEGVKGTVTVTVHDIIGNDNAINPANFVTAVRKVDLNAQGGYTVNLGDVTSGLTKGTYLVRAWCDVTEYSVTVPYYAGFGGDGRDPNAVTAGLTDAGNPVCPTGLNAENVTGTNITGGTGVNKNRDAYFGTRQYLPRVANDTILGYEVYVIDNNDHADNSTNCNGRAAAEPGLKSVTGNGPLQLDFGYAWEAVTAGKDKPQTQHFQISDQTFAPAAAVQDVAGKLQTVQPTYATGGVAVTTTAAPAPAVTMHPDFTG